MSDTRTAFMEDKLDAVIQTDPEAMLTGRLRTKQR